MEGRPPAKTFKAPFIKFSTSSHLYAIKESPTLTKVYAFTSLVHGKHADLHEVTYIRTKVDGDKVDNVDVCPDAASCPWTSELPHVISNWSDTHARMDCFDDFAFWCSFPKNMLPTPFVSSDTVLDPDDAKRSDNYTSLCYIVPFETDDAPQKIT